VIGELHNIDVIEVIGQLLARIVLEIINGILISKQISMKKITVLQNPK
jgi:hypothetical protein